MNPILHDFPEEAVTTVSSAPAAPPVTLLEDDEAHEKKRQQAFDAEFAWHGSVLHPFSSSRAALFLQHRAAMGAPDLQRCIDDLDAFFADAARILWLCSHPPEAWAILRSSPADMQTAIDAWTDEHIPAREMPEATLLGFRIYAASRANEHVPAPPRHKPHGDDVGN